MRGTKCSGWSVLVLSLRSRHGPLAFKAWMSSLEASCSAHLEVTPIWRGAAAVWGRLAPGQQGSGGLGCTQTPEQFIGGQHSLAVGRGHSPGHSRPEPPSSPAALSQQSCSVDMLASNSRWHDGFCLNPGACKSWGWGSYLLQ